MSIQTLPIPSLDNPQSVLERKFVRTSPLLWLLGGVFCVFLSALFSRALYDIADLFQKPIQRESVELSFLKAKHVSLYDAPDLIAEKISFASRELKILQQGLDAIEKNYENRLEARKAGLLSDKEDKELRTLRAEIEKLREERNQKQVEIDQLYQSPNPRVQELSALDKKIEEKSAVELAEYQQLHTKWRVRVILFRLSATLPFLLIAILLWYRRNKIKYITLFWGYEAAVAWTVIFALAPYLPYYGGYIPLLLGSVFSVLLVVSLVRFLNKRASIRKQKIIDRFILKHTCPACERDYLVGMESKAEETNRRVKKIRYFEQAALSPKHCPSCGLSLFESCTSCQHVQLAYLQYCSACGHNKP